MCGIFCLFGDRDGVKVQSGQLAHRGPDSRRVMSTDNVYMEFFRLSINDLSSRGMQPFVYDNKLFVCNGEMYNHKDHGGDENTSDCQTMFELMSRNGVYMTCRTARDSEFAFCYYDGSRFFAGRDPIGVRPLFYTHVNSRLMAFASEAKSLLQFGSRIEIFPPGHIYCSFTHSFMCYAPSIWRFQKRTQINLKDPLVEAVRDRFDNSQREVGFLLSGGLDSSLVCAIAARIISPDQPIKTFTIGVPDSPDAVAAKKVADFLGTEHTHFVFDFQEALRALPAVIRSLESYDTTTVRASVPMWLMCKKIREFSNCRVILSGEGSDELLAGYRYFKNAPDSTSLFYETVRRMQLLHQFDVLRADRCSAGHGLELRVPFLDGRFVEAAMSTCPKAKMTPVEKAALRSQFEGFLPEEILWRTKDAFSDAVGYGWVDFIREHAETYVSDAEFKKIQAASAHHNCPTTKEEAMYRSIFRRQFGPAQDHLISEIWRPLWTNVTDPSARHIKINSST